MIGGIGLLTHFLSSCPAALPFGVKHPENIDNGRTKNSATKPSIYQDLQWIAVDARRAEEPSWTVTYHPDQSGAAPKLRVSDLSVTP